MPHSSIVSGSRPSSAAYPRTPASTSSPCLRSDGFSFHSWRRATASSRVGMDRLSPRAVVSKRLLAALASAGAPGGVSQPTDPLFVHRALDRQLEELAGSRVVTGRRGDALQQLSVGDRRGTARQVDLLVVEPVPIEGLWP